MIKVIGVSFEGANKIYYFLPNGKEVKKDQNVIVETERGQQFGKIVTNIIEIDEIQISFPLKNVIRISTIEDNEKNKNNLIDSKKAVEEASNIIKELNLKMTILSANFTFDRKQLLFNFLADERVDFRTLAKKLAGIYKTRIELRQIGVRDKAKEVGGLGQCGRELCCSVFLKDLNSVSINMAKNQNLALTPQKINGSCGRLMCCLNFENDIYTSFKKELPKINEKVDTKQGKGKVISVDILDRSYKIELEDNKIIDIKL